MTQAANGGDGAFARVSADREAERPEAPPRPSSNRIATDCDTAADDLVRLVLALVEALRQLVERQAIRRVEGGRLSDDEVERLGLTLMRLEQRMTELKTHFGLEDDDLTLRLGSMEEFADLASDKKAAAV